MTVQSLTIAMASFAAIGPWLLGGFALGLGLLVLSRYLPASGRLLSRLRLTLLILLARMRLRVTRKRDNPYFHAMDDGKN